MGDDALRAGCYLIGEEGESDFWGRASDVAGLFASVDEGLRRVKLTGIAPQGRLLSSVKRIGSKRAYAGNAELVLLNVHGDEIGSYFVADVTADSVESSTAGGKFVDLTVALDCEELLPEAERTWDLLRAAKLTRTGMWRSLAREDWHGWLSVALNHHAYREIIEPEQGSIYEIDGGFIVDEASFYCSLGEAINGPVGYFGWNLSALEDCLIGDWGASRPFTLNWHNSSESRARIMDDAKVGTEYEGRFLEFLDEIFDRRGVEVNLL